MLRSDGPATATELARILEESSGSTSYHLRQLERYGFVADAAQQPSGRERRWTAVHDMTTLPDSLAELPGAREALDQVHDRQLRVLADGVSDYLLDLDPGDLRELTEEISAVVERYRTRAGSQPVTLHVVALPLSS